MADVTVALLAFPLWLGLVFTVVAGLALSSAVREVLLWRQHLADRRAARRWSPGRDSAPASGPSGR